MAPPPGDELEYLKSLRTRLQAKIDELEKKVKSALPPPVTNEKELRMILMGPPGAGKLSFNDLHEYLLDLANICFMFFCIDFSTWPMDSSA
jgi:hypothetical protein